jgi:hypothetical protein
MTSRLLKGFHTIKITFGHAKDAVGADIEGGEDWKPLFFTVDITKAVHIPDFYKNRIAVYAVDGRLQASKPCPAGLSPRMNYFSLTSQGHYITVSDYQLYCLNNKAGVLWKKDLGYGNIPEYMYTGKTALYIVLPFGEQRTLVFDYASEQPTGWLGIKQPGESIPLVMENAGVYFTSRLSQMKKLAGMSTKAYTLNEDAMLLYISPANESLWKSRKEQSEIYYLFSPQGQLLHQAALIFPPGVGEGSGFWTVIGEKFIIYKNYFYKDYMEIVAYKWPET